jgi:hypothetical protein
MDEAERQRQAKVLLDEALRRYNAGEYEPAIESFKAAYALAPAPGLLFNIAQAYRLAGKGHCLDAVRTYRSYLDASPSASNRDKVEAHLKSLEACARDEQKVAVAELHPQPAATPTVQTTVPPAAVQPPPPEIVEPMPQQPVKIRWPPIALGAGGIVVGAVGGILYGWAGLQFTQLQMACAPGCDPSRTAGPQAVEQASIALLIVGAAALFGAAIWWIAQ